MKLLSPLRSGNPCSSPSKISKQTDSDRQIAPSHPPICHNSLRTSSNQSQRLQPLYRPPPFLSSIPPPSNSVRRPHLTTALPNPIVPTAIPKTLVRSNLARPHRRLVHGRRRIARIVSRRRRRVRAALHADEIRMLLLLPVAVVRVLMVHRGAVRMVVVAWVGRVVVAAVPLYHPAVVG